MLLILYLRLPAIIYQKNILKLTSMESKLSDFYAQGGIPWNFLRVFEVSSKSWVELIRPLYLCQHFPNIYVSEKQQ